VASAIHSMSGSAPDGLSPRPQKQMAAKSFAAKCFW